MQWGWGSWHSGTAVDSIPRKTKQSRSVVTGLTQECSLDKATSTSVTMHEIATVQDPHTEMKLILDGTTEMKADCIFI